MRFLILYSYFNKHVSHSHPSPVTCVVLMPSLLMDIKLVTFIHELGFKQPNSDLNRNSYVNKRKSGGTLHNKRSHNHNLFISNIDKTIYHNTVT